VKVYSVGYVIVIRNDTVYKIKKKIQIFFCIEQAVSPPMVDAMSLGGLCLLLPKYSPVSIIPHIHHLIHSLSPTMYNLSKLRRGFTTTRLLESRLRFPMVSLDLFSNKNML
jgi:hypothetical protein